jgi:hypothetical protein
MLKRISFGTLHQTRFVGRDGIPRFKKGPSERGKAVLTRVSSGELNKPDGVKALEKLKLGVRAARTM